VLLLLLLHASTSALAVDLRDRTPAETYQLILLLTDEVKALRQQQGVQDPWPSVAVVGKKEARHEYQKALEVLSKINRYRIIHKLGGIETPNYPSRELTPNEVYDLVERLVRELQVLSTGSKGVSSQSPIKAGVSFGSRGENYRQLWVISKAFDPLLGVRGFLPSDVFAQSERIVALVRFLRVSQAMPSMPPKPKKTKGKHPNHALAASYQLLAAIQKAERNLWMDPVTVPPLKKRVITPTEVYDALQTNIAELQRIKFRLGVDRTFDEVERATNKTPDDVIQNLRWAMMAMPTFPLTKRLIQYDPKTLEKNPNDVFAMVQLTLEKLRYYKRFRGIRVEANTPPDVSALQPRHVYQKILESLRKVVSLRQQAGFSASAIPLFPMRLITSSDVFMVASRLNRALDLIYDAEGVPAEMFKENIVHDKTPNEVFRVAWQISYELDTILGTQGQTPDDVFQMARFVVAHIQRLQQKLGVQDPIVSPPPLIPHLKPADVFVQAESVLSTIAQLKQRAGIFGTSLPVAEEDGVVTPNDVFNLVSVLLADIVEVEIHLGITTQLPLPSGVKGKTPSDVFQQLAYANKLLHGVLGAHDQ